MSFLAHRRKAFTAAAPATDFGNASRVFDGADYITIPDSASFPTGAQTWCCWVYPDALSGLQVFLAHYDLGVRSIMILASGTSLAAYISSDGATTESIVVSGLSNSAWQHVAVEYIPSTSLKIFLNGSEHGSNTTSISSSLNDSTSPASIGSYGNGSNKFTGKICDCRLYDTNIGVTNILGLKNGTDYQTNLIGHWLKDADDAVTDYAGTFSDATNNGTTYSTESPF